MAKSFTGTVVSTKMNNTVVVEVVTKTPHRLYKKLLKHTKRFKVDTTGVEVALGDTVQFEQTRPISKEKSFELSKVLFGSKRKDKKE